MTVGGMYDRGDTGGLGCQAAKNPGLGGVGMDDRRPLSTDESPEKQERSDIPEWIQLSNQCRGGYSSYALSFRQTDLVCKSRSLQFRYPGLMGQAIYKRNIISLCQANTCQERVLG